MYLTSGVTAQGSSPRRYRADSAKSWNDDCQQWHSSVGTYGIGGGGGPPLYLAKMYGRPSVAENRSVTP